ncbi:MAG: CvpA family protein [Ignavibacteriae bacterium]|nr:MAG: CvpA family protein [Ignavibacteriota bacterium]
MNWLDLVIIIIVALSLFYGYRKGFLRKILGIAGLILGFILAIRFYKPVSGIFSGLFGISGAVSSVLAFLLVIGIVFGLAVWLARFIASMNAGTTAVDKILGAITGLIQGLIIASILMVNFTYMNYPSAAVRQNSLLYPRVYNIAPAVMDRIIELSPDLKSLYLEYKNRLVSNEQNPNNRR